MIFRRLPPTFRVSVLLCLVNVFFEQGSPMRRGGCAGVCCPHGLPTEGSENQNATRHPLPRGRSPVADRDNRDGGDEAPPSTHTSEMEGGALSPPWRCTCPTTTGSHRRSAAHTRLYAIALAVGLPSDRCGGAALGISWFPPLVFLRPPPRACHPKRPFPASPDGQARGNFSDAGHVESPDRGRAAAADG